MEVLIYSYRFSVFKTDFRWLRKHVVGHCVHTCRRV
nr:MAG TPA: hypothetical protein [Caudoviricetes sp.]